MSSEISIEVTSTQLGSGKDEGFRPWHFFVLASILLATVAVIMARRSTPEHLVFLSLTIAAAGAAAGAFYRMLAPLTAPILLRMGAPVSERTRARLEREKTLVLRSIKELEFDRAMGKLSESDFEEMSGRLRARARSLMKQLDLGSAGYTMEIERQLAARKRSDSSARPNAGPGPAGRSDNACACGTVNDGDAVFCKKCGARLQS